MAQHYRSFAEFWPFYLGEHAAPANRALHFLGSSFALLQVGYALATQHYAYLLTALLTGYGFAWIGHFFLEKNRPATFSYPWFSFMGDWKMWWLTCTGQMQKELQRLSIARKAV